MVIKQGYGPGFYSKRKCLRLGHIYVDGGPLVSTIKAFGVYFRYLGLTKVRTADQIADRFAGIEVYLGWVWFELGVCWAQGKHERRKK